MLMGATGRRRLRQVVECLLRRPRQPTEHSSNDRFCSGLPNIATLWLTTRSRPRLTTTTKLFDRSAHYDHES
ncbi:hypothetical protein BST61_g6790 [Cercospora zeina]